VIYTERYILVEDVPWRNHAAQVTESGLGIFEGSTDVLTKMLALNCKLALISAHILVTVGILNHVGVYN